MTQETYDVRQVIEAFGGTNATARLCDITPGAVSQWIRNGIPKPQLNFLKAKRPKVFKKLTAARQDQPSQ
jgi:hypothetical protein